MLPADYHIHTCMCGHATGGMEDYVRAAIKAGLDEICFTDHCPIPIPVDSQYCMKSDEISLYVDSILQLKKKYNNIITLV